MSRLLAALDRALHNFFDTNAWYVSIRAVLFVGVPLLILVMLWNDYWKFAGQ